MLQLALQLAQQSSSSLFAPALVAFNVVLRRLSGRDLIEDPPVCAAPG